MSGTAYDRLLDRLRQEGKTVRQDRPDHAMAQCPVHDDRNPSLSITRAPDKVLISCQAGCPTDEVIAVLNLTWDDLRDQPKVRDQQPIVVAEYSYVDEAGKVLYVKQRLAPKAFRQYVPTPGGRQWSLNGVRRVLYRLPEVLAAIEANQLVYVVEGEKDADRLAADGVTATCNSEGAAKPGQTPKWRSEYTKLLRGAHVVVIAHRDPPGRAHAANIVQQLTGVAASVRLQEPAAGNDAFDHLDAGHGVGDFIEVENNMHDQQPAGEEPKRRVQLTPASTIKPQPVRWAWADRIPAGEITLTPGRGGVGKSTFHAWVIAHLTCGTLPGVHFGVPKPCIIAASEDSWERTIVPRLIAAGADLDLVYRVDVITETNEVVAISLPDDIEGLTEEITRIGAALLSIDPVMSVLSNTLDTHKDREVRLALEPLGRLADRTGCVVLGNAHFNKSAGSDPLALIMGSSAFGNVVRAALGFARDTEADDGSCVISQAKNNLGRMDLPSLRYRIDAATIDTDEGPADVGKLVMLGESDRTVTDILRDRNTDGDDRSERDEAADWLRAYLEDQGGAADSKDIKAAAKEAGIAVRTVERARSKASVTVETSGFPRRSTWSVAPHSRQSRQSRGGGATGATGGATGQEPVEESTEGTESVCAVCGFPLHAFLVAAGETTHPNCQEETP